MRFPMPRPLSILPALVLLLLAGAPCARADESTPPDKWLKPLKGSATGGQFISHLSAGFAGGSSPAGASSQEWNVQADTLRSTDRDTFRADGAWFYALASDHDARSSAQLRAMQDWRLSDSRWLAFARVESQHDSVRQWQWRLASYGGMGYTLMDDDRWEVIGRGGLGGRYDFGSVNEFTPEVVVGGSAIGWKIAKNQKLAGECLAYQSLDNADVWRFSGKAEWQIQLSPEQKTMLKIGVRDEYESQHPANQDGHDLHYYVGIGVELR